MLTRTSLTGGYVCVQSPFSNQELDTLDNLGRALEIEKGNVVPASHESEKEKIANIRNSDIAWITPQFFHETDNDELFWKLQRFIDEVNMQFFGFELQVTEPLQYTVYDGAKKQYYNTHIDCNFAETGRGRKLSFTLQLTDGQQYTGGDLVINERNLSVTDPIYRNRGVMTFFPSYLSHSVMPVQSGIRKSLVGWASGPLFK